MRTAAIALLVALGACKASDPYPLRGGGGGGGTHGGDADANNGGGGDGGGTAMSGVVCVVLDLRAPFACGDISEAHGVAVGEFGGDSTVSDATGAFTLSTPTTSPLLVVGSAPGDRLLTTLHQVNATDAPVEAPAVDETLFSDTLLSLQESLTTGAMLIYVTDSSGPVANAQVSGGSQSSRLYYDDGAGGFDANATATGADGLALILDTIDADIQASDGSRTATTSVATTPGGVGLAVIQLQ